MNLSNKQCNYLINTSESKKWKVYNSKLHNYQVTNFELHNEIKDIIVSYCKDIGLDVIGLMCIPPANTDPENYFEEMKKLNNTSGLRELSMGMSSDFLTAAKHLATYVRIGSSIFGQRY